MAETKDTLDEIRRVLDAELSALALAIQEIIVHAEKKGLDAEYVRDVLEEVFESHIDAMCIDN